MKLAVCLEIVAVLQLALAVVNLMLIRLLSWKEDLERMPLLIREVFQVHVWFISATLAIFGLMTLGFSEEMAGGQNEALGWLAGAIGLFWGLRTVLQVTYYSASHWRGIPMRTAAHVAFLMMYGTYTVVYLLAAQRALFAN